MSGTLKAGNPEGIAPTTSIPMALQAEQSDGSDGEGDDDQAARASAA